MTPEIKYIMDYASRARKMAAGTHNTEDRDAFMQMAVAAESLALDMQSGLHLEGEDYGRG